MADAQLKAALLMARKTPMNFVLVVHGSDTALTLSRKSIVAKEVKDMKDEAGGGKIYRGVVEGGSKGLVFKTSGQPPASLDRMVKRCIKDDAGLSIPVSVEAE